MKVICLYCNNEFKTFPSRIRIGKGKYCSRSCKDSALIGKPSWNKGLKGVQPMPANVWKKGEMVGEKNYSWKGIKASYVAIHQWLKRELGKPEICVHCGGNRNMVWANKSHEYKRDLTDWIPLCSPCHGKYDSKENRGIMKRYYNSKLQRL